MKTQSKAMAILTVLINNHAAIVEHGSNNVNVINRMNRLLTILREVCFNLDKMEEKTASAIMETADNIVSEAIASYLNDIKFVEEYQESVEYLNTTDTESFDCNDEYCNAEKQLDLPEPPFRTMDSEFEGLYVKHPILWKFNGQVLTTTNLNDLPF